MKSKVLILLLVLVLVLVSVAGAANNTVTINSASGLLITPAPGVSDMPRFGAGLKVGGVSTSSPILLDSTGLQRAGDGGYIINFDQTLRLPGGTVIVDWANQTLKNTANTAVLDWSGTNTGAPIWFDSANSYRISGNAAGLTGLQPANISGITTVGVNLLALPNPGVISFIKIAADNSISTRSASQLLSDLGAAASGSNSDITALSALTATTSLNSISYGGSSLTIDDNGSSGHAAIAMISDGTPSVTPSLRLYASTGLSDYLDLQNSPPGASGIDLRLTRAGNLVNSISFTVTGAVLKIGDSGGAAAPIDVDHVRLNPRGSAPSSPSLGWIYVSTDTHCYFYNGSSWVQMDN